MRDMTRSRWATEGWARLRSAWGFEWSWGWWACVPESLFVAFFGGLFLTCEYFGGMSSVGKRGPVMRLILYDAVCIQLKHTALTRRGKKSCRWLSEKERGKYHCTCAAQQDTQDGLEDASEKQGSWRERDRAAASALLRATR